MKGDITYEEDRFGSVSYTHLYGHTHIKVNEASEAHPGLWLFNPGSVSIPKDGAHSYGIYEGGAFSHVILEEE